MGDVSNDGTSNVDYVTSIKQHTATPGSGFFVNGKTTGTHYADFDQSYDAVNGLTYQSAFRLRRKVGSRRCRPGFEAQPTGRSRRGDPHPLRPAIVGRPANRKYDCSAASRAALNRPLTPRRLVLIS